MNVKIGFLGRIEPLKNCLPVTPACYEEISLSFETLEMAAAIP